MITPDVIQASSLQTLDDIVALVKEELNHSKQAIHTNLEKQLPFLADVIQHMINSHKIPLRSIVLSLTARLFLYSGEKLRHVSSVLEYLNTASTLHQKIVLTEDHRRKQKAVRNIWGNEASVLLGDYLLSISFQTMTRLEDLDLLEKIAIATQSIARGQVLSISPFAWDSATNHYLKVIQNRKASLFVAAADSGAILGKAGIDAQKVLREYSLNLGIGVQLKKDLADADNLQILKARLNKNHIFFPLCYLMEVMQQNGKATLLKQILDCKELSEDHVQQIQLYFEEYHVYEHTSFCIQSYLQQAESALIDLNHLDITPLLRLAQCALAASGKNT